MSGGVYGGDEVGALVFDPGHYSFRVGFAGEDSPKSEIPSMVGISEDVTTPGAGDEVKSETAMEVDGKPVDTANVTKKKYHMDTNALHFPKKGMEVKEAGSPLSFFSFSLFATQSHSTPCLQVDLQDLSFYSIITTSLTRPYFHLPFAPFPGKKNKNGQDSFSFLPSTFP